MLAAPAERGLKDGHVSKGAVNQGYTGCYKEVNGIVVDPTVGNSVNLFVNLGPLAIPHQNTGQQN